MTGCQVRPNELGAISQLFATLYTFFCPLECCPAILFQSVKL